MDDFNLKYSRQRFVANSFENMLLLIEQGIDGVYFRDDKELANLLDNAALDIYVYALKAFGESELEERIKKTAAALGDSFKDIFRCGALSPYDVRRAKSWFKAAALFVDELRCACSLNTLTKCKQLNKALDAYAATKP